MMKYTYLLINIATVFFPLVLSFDKRVAFSKSWKLIWPGMGITGLLFLVWDILFTQKGVWSFNPNYVLGLNILGLPVEEILFFLSVPFACIFIYACVAHYIKWQLSDMVVDVLSNAIIVYAILNVVFNYQKLYTLVTFSLLAVVLIVVQYVIRRRWLHRFYVTYVISLIPFYIINGILTSIPIVMYNNAQNLGKRVGTIPVEDHFYLMALLLMNIAFYEYYRQKGVVKGE